MEIVNRLIIGYGGHEMHELVKLNGNLRNKEM